jgi:hypothetical protein
MDDNNALITLEQLRLAELKEIAADRPKLLQALDILDRLGGEEDTGLDKLLSASLWKQAQAQRTLSSLDEAYLIYRLKQSVMAEVWHGGEVATMMVLRWTTWDDDLFERYDADPAEAWKHFCINYLGMDPNTAYQRWKTWDLYHNTLGWTRDQMERAGIAKLSQARGRIAQDWEAGGTDDTLITLLTGETYEEQGEEPPDDRETTDYAIPPASHAEVVSHLQERKQSQGPARGDRPTFTFATTGDGGESLVTCWVTRPGDPVAVPVDLAILKTLPRPDCLDEDEWRAALGQLKGRVGK